ncbi:MAG: RdgB/HAM1 family non-canonical purine NTP pyrophosphatase [Firmicutes bacterium]|nr:RdgB/HAM1 family non-canonical purine NTP pyrophosphatase [Bacillota bacterium]
MKLIAATQNKHKLVEINAITKDFGFELIPMNEAGLGDLDVEETGSTFEENSFIKAAEVCRLTGHAAIADDSGLMVDALGGAPGVYSARFAGVHGDDAANRRKLLEELGDLPLAERGAKFVSVITIAWPDGEKTVARGECPGTIIFEERGDGGFGYDSLFVPEGGELTFAQISPEEKNAVSHRARALAKLRTLLEAR